MPPLVRKSWPSAAPSAPTRTRLILQLGAESLLLGLLGGVAGILLAYCLVPLLLALGPADLPRRSQVRLDGAAVAFGFGLAVMAGLLSGIVPALQATGAVRPVGSLTGRTVASSRAHARRAVVLVEVALSLVILAGAGLLLKSFVRLQRVDPGFRTERLLTLRLSLPAGRYAQREQFTAFYDRLHTRLRALPDVEAVGVSSVAPLTAWRASVNFTTEGAALQGNSEVPLAQYRAIDAGYLAAAGTPLLAGRALRRDGRQRKRLRGARQSHPGPPLLSPGDAAWPRRPLRRRRRARARGDGGRYRGGREALHLSDAPTFDIYVPLRQAPQAVARWLANGTSWVVRTRAEPRRGGRRSAPRWRAPRSRGGRVERSSHGGSALGDAGASALQPRAGGDVCRGRPSNCFTTGSPLRMKLAKTVTMISAADVITRALVATPSITALRLSPSAA